MFVSAKYLTTDQKYLARMSEALTKMVGEEWNVKKMSYTEKADYQIVFADGAIAETLNVKDYTRFKDEDMEREILNLGNPKSDEFFGNFAKLYKKVEYDMRNILEGRQPFPADKDIAEKAYEVTASVIRDYKPNSLSPNFDKVNNAKRIALAAIDNPEFKKEQTEMSAWLQDRLNNDRDDR